MKNNIENCYICNRFSENYPKKLKYIENPPEKLYVLGKLPDENKKCVAIVGARQCSNYGRKMAFEYAKILSGAGVEIISGMARGIDAAAHEGALAAGGDTFAVLGCGVDVCYPKTNKGVYDLIKQKGGIISEFEFASPPSAWHFPLRNRIISGFADLILVVEAKIKSGSLITADLALEQGKDVFALPGRVGDSLSVGCNRLISQGAGIAWTPNEILVALFHNNGAFYEKELNSDSNKAVLHQENENTLGWFQQKNNSGIAHEEKMVYSCMSLQPRHIDEIIDETGLEFSVVLNAVFSLEMQGLIEETAKNYFSLSRFYKGIKQV